MSNDNIANLLSQRESLVNKLIDVAAYSEYHDGLNTAIKAIDDLILEFKEQPNDPA